MITNIAKEALEKKHELIGSAFNTYLGNESEQRNIVKKLEVLCSTRTGMPILDWIRAYCDEYPAKGVQDPNFKLASFERVKAIEEMEQTVEHIYTSKTLETRKTHFQIVACHRLLRLSYRAKVCVLEWLMAYYTKQSTTPQPNERTYNCPNPNCNFTTTNYYSWLGHGPSRCLRKSERLNSSAK